MRILITNNHLQQMGGTETWVLTMARHLAKQHDVGVFTHKKGFVSDLLKDLIDDNPKGYDLALINHNTCIDVDADYKIFTSHGMWHELEVPKDGCDDYVAVSENVAQHHKIKRIIKNPIDTERFKPQTDISEHLNSILAITDAPIPFEVTRPSRVRDNMPELINGADLVITIGRGVLEAMSCARNVVVWDNRGFVNGGDGYKSDPSISGNVGGRYDRDVDLVEELKLYNPKDGKVNREYILKHHRVEDIASEYTR